jgi:CTP synthase
LIKEGTLAHRCYAKKLIHERHRHRYEFNNVYKETFEKAGMIFSGTLEHGTLLEISEISDHPWMLGVQFHPEFKSRPLEPHPLFRDFIQTLKDRPMISAAPSGKAFIPNMV